MHLRERQGLPGVFSAAAEVRSRCNTNVIIGDRGGPLRSAVLPSGSSNGKPKGFRICIGSLDEQREQQAVGSVLLELPATAAKPREILYERPSLKWSLLTLKIYEASAGSPPILQTRVRHVAAAVAVSSATAGDRVADLQQFVFLLFAAEIFRDS